MKDETGSYRYSEALEQQLALTRHLLSPHGPSVLQDTAGKLLVGSELGKDARWRAQIMAGEVSHAMPFFWTAPIARAIREAAETMPAYTFTEDAFPCPIGFVWFETPVPLEPGEPAASLRALSWRVGPSSSGREVAALLNGWLATSQLPSVVLGLREWVDMGWTLADANGAASDALRVVHGAEPPTAQAALVDSFLRFVAGCLSFLEQRIVVADRRPPSRPLRRRLDRERYRGETSIGVIALRTCRILLMPLPRAAIGSTSGSCVGALGQAVLAWGEAATAWTMVICLPYATWLRFDPEFEVLDAVVVPDTISMMHVFRRS